MSGSMRGRLGLRFGLLTTLFAILHGVVLTAIFFFWIIGGFLGEMKLAPPAGPAVAAGGPLVVALALPFLFTRSLGVPPKLAYILNSIAYGAALAGVVNLIAAWRRRRGPAGKPPVVDADVS